MNIYVGNLARQATEDDLRPLFEPFGKIMSVNVIKDKFSGESKGFGFVEMPGKAEAEKAMAALNTFEFNGKKPCSKRSQTEKRSGKKKIIYSSVNK